MAITYVYILRCGDGSFYVGIANDVPARVERHNCGKGALWTARRLPVFLVCSEAFNDMASAIARERQLKGWSRRKKEALIAGNTPDLRRFSRCRTQHGTI